MSKYALKEKTFKIQEGPAIDQLLGFLEFYEMDINEVDRENKKATERVFDKIVGYIKTGRLAFDGAEVTQTLKDSDGDLRTLQYPKITGGHQYALQSETHRDQAMEIVGSMTGISLNGVKKLQGVDLAVAITLGSLFLS